MRSDETPRIAKANRVTKRKIGKASPETLINGPPLAA